MKYLLFKNYLLFKSLTLAPFKIKAFMLMFALGTGMNIEKVEQKADLSEDCIEIKSEEIPSFNDLSDSQVLRDSLIEAEQK